MKERGINEDVDNGIGYCGVCGKLGDVCCGDPEQQNGTLVWGEATCAKCCISHPRTPRKTETLK